MSRSGEPADARAAVVPAQRAHRGRPSPASGWRPGAVVPRSRAATPRSPGLSRHRRGRAAQATRTRGTRRGIRGGRARAPRIEAQLRCSARVLAPDRPDQRIHPRRLTHGRPAGHHDEPYFRAGHHRPRRSLGSSCASQRSKASGERPAGRQRLRRRPRPQREPTAALDPAKEATYTDDLPPSDALDDGWQAISVPAPHLRRPAGTIGLGDTLTGGVLLAESLSL